jgi:hypothetical protein
MAEREEGIWGGEAGELGRRRSESAGPSLTLPAPHGTEWGLASLVAAGACLLLCPGALLVWISYVHAPFWSHPDHRTISVVLLACHFLALGLTAMALAFAIVGLTAARRQQTPIALPLTGLIVSGVTLLFWLLIIICTFADAIS